MSRQKNLMKNTAILSLSTFIPKLVAIVVTPVLTAHLTKEEYGQYDLIATVVSLLLPAVTLQISSAAFRFLIDKKNDRVESARIVSNIFAFVIPMSLAAIAVYSLVVGADPGINHGLICLYFFSDIILIVTQQVARGLGKNLVYSVSAVIRSAVDMLCVLLLVGGLGRVNLGLTGVLIAMTLSTIAAWLFLAVKTGIFGYLGLKYISGGVLKELLAYSWPMVPNNLSGWVLRLSNRLVITAFLGIEANAVYAAANKIPHVFSAVQNTFIYAWQENASIASIDEDKDAYYSQMCDGIFRVVLGLMAGLIMASPVLFRLLIRGDYDGAYEQMPVLFLGMLFSCMSSVVGGIYIAFKKTKSVGISTMVAALLNLAIDLALIREIGIWAGSVSTAASYLALLVYRMVDVQKFQKVTFHIPRICLGVLLLVVMAWLNFQRNLLCDGMNVLLFAGIILLFDRDMLKIMYKKFRKKLLKR